MTGLYVQIVIKCSLNMNIFVYRNLLAATVESVDLEPYAEVMTSMEHLIKRFGKPSLKTSRTIEWVLQYYGQIYSIRYHDRKNPLQRTSLYDFKVSCRSENIQKKVFLSHLDSRI